MANMLPMRLFWNEFLPGLRQRATPRVDAKYKH